jgi:hypothetical protein
MLYESSEIKVCDCEPREPKTTCTNNGLLVPISEITNNLDIDTVIVPKIIDFPMQEHDD